MKINNPLPAPAFDVETTMPYVFNAIPPGAFTDLDLSAVVGTRHAKVHLRIGNVTGGLATFTLRRNGETGVPVDGVQTSGNIADGSVCFLICDTDINGIIEWFSTVAAGTVTIRLLNWVGEA